MKEFKANLPSDYMSNPNNGRKAYEHVRDISSGITIVEIESKEDLHKSLDKIISKANELESIHKPYHIYMCETLSKYYSYISSGKYKGVDVSILSEMIMKGRIQLQEKQDLEWTK